MTDPNKPPVLTADMALRLSVNDRGIGSVEFWNQCKAIRAIQDGKTTVLPTADLQALVDDAKKYRALATPEIADFMAAVEREALHQRDRWATSHDAGKTDADWFWLIGYLAGKALNKPEKALHHIITTAAACLNWHAAKVGAHNAMRPGNEDGIDS
jgi:hypothetical protein